MLNTACCDVQAQSAYGCFACIDVHEYSDHYMAPDARVIARDISGLSYSCAYSATHLLLYRCVNNEALSACWTARSPSWCHTVSVKSKMHHMSPCVCHTAFRDNYNFCITPHVSDSPLAVARISAAHACMHTTLKEQGLAQTHMGSTYKGAPTASCTVRYYTPSSVAPS